MQPRASTEVVNLPSHCLGMQVIPVLGHVLANDGAIRSAWTSTHAAMLRGFWKQVRAANVSLTSEHMFQVIVWRSGISLCGHSKETSLQSWTTCRRKCTARYWPRLVYQLTMLQRMRSAKPEVRRPHVWVVAHGARDGPSDSWPSLSIL